MTTSVIRSSCRFPRRKLHRKDSDKDTITLHRGPKNSLKIQFRRTIRVPDVQNGASELPPSMGHFPLYPVAAYAEKLPKAMATRGGVFFPMYRKWLLWVADTSLELIAS